MYYDQIHDTLSYMYDIIPPKKSSRLSVLQEIRGISLTASAAQMILSEATVVSEGDSNLEDLQEDVYRGSTLVSVDLAAPPFALPKDEAFLEHFRHAAAHSIMLHIGLLRLTRKEAERRAYPKFIREMRADTAFRIVDNTLLVDIDIECPLAETMGRFELERSSGK